MTSVEVIRIKKSLLEFLQEQKPTSEESKRYLDMSIQALEKELNRKKERVLEYTPDNEFITMLQNYGLKISEARILDYLIHQQDPSNVATLCKKTGMARTDVYAKLTDLERDGFVITIPVVTPLKFIIYPNLIEKLLRRVHTDKEAKLELVEKIKSHLQVTS